MDPASILSIVSAAGSLAFKCASIVQTLHSLTERYKQAELVIVSVIQDCRTIELAWSRIEIWASIDMEMLHDEELAARLQHSIYTGQLTMTALEKDLANLANAPRYSALRRRTKIMWNESMLREHQDRLQRQVTVLTLLLTVIQLPSASDRTEALSVKEHVFRSVDDSVYSIVPTRLSMSSDDAASIRSFEDHDLSYIPFTFENDLFTSHVYKRNFRVTQLEIKQVPQIPSVIHPARPTKMHGSHVVHRPEEQTGLIQHAHANVDHPSTTVGSTEITERSSMPTPCGPGSQSRQLRHLDLDIISVCDNTGSCQQDHLDKSPSIVTSFSMAQNELVTPGSQVEEYVVEAVQTIPEVLHKPSPTDILRTTYELASPVDFLTEKMERVNTEAVQSPEITLSNRCSSFITQIMQGNSHVAREWARDEVVDSMFCHSAHFIADLDTILMLKCLHKQDRTLFCTIMQVLGFLRGSRFLEDLAIALTTSHTKFAMLEEAPSQVDGSVESTRVGNMLDHPAIASAAGFRDLASCSGMVDHYPTVLQLACVARRPLVVEYLLSIGQPTVWKWKVHPFIIATKRRCKAILELFVKLAKGTINQYILNTALAMVVNQDCALSEICLQVNQNDNKRVGEDVNIASFLLASGASPNAKDQNAISVLSMAIRAASAANPFSLQIIEILLCNGADFGWQEQEDMSLLLPTAALDRLMRRHKLIIQPRHYGRSTLHSDVYLRRAR
ncbi:hypothetical protein ACN47E_002645 [Coniothyrium glycines]